MKTITWILGFLFLLTGGCGLFHQQSPCQEYGVAAGDAALMMCVATIKENADEAAKRWSKRAEADVQTDER